MEKLLRDILDEMQDFKVNAETQRDNGTKAAGARARKNSLTIEKLLKEFRKESVKEGKI